MLRRLSIPALFLAIAAIAASANVLNAVLIFDDLYILEYMGRFLAENGLRQTAKILFFSLEHGSREYRLYGFSKLLHLGLFLTFGMQSWAYALFISVSQSLSGWGLYHLLRRLRFDRLQASLPVLIWIVSPFAVTACFHHYSYLILPFQLVILLAILLQLHHRREGGHNWLLRAGSAALAVVIAYAGEVHLITAGLLTMLITFGWPSGRRFLQRVVDAAIPLAAITVAILAHRFIWLRIVPQTGTPPRYSVSVSDLNEIGARSWSFVQSIPEGGWQQIDAIFTLAGPWALAVVLVGSAAIGVAGIRPFRTERTDAIDNLRALTALMLIALSTFAVLWLVGVLSGQVSPTLPRRYGYVPYTSIAMLTVAVLASPAIRLRITAAPAIIVCLLAVGTWTVLEFIDLPRVRGEDQEVWGALQAEISKKPNAAVLFVNAWNHPAAEGYAFGVSTPGPRGPDFPSVFESPLLGYWWESRYALDLLGAGYVGHWFTDETSESIVLLDNFTPPTTVPKASLVVLADLNSTPPTIFASPAERVTIFSDWDAFAASSAYRRQ